MASDLTAAADAIDHLIDALPDHLRLPRWAVDGDQIVTLDAAGDPDLLVASQHGADDGPAVVQLVHALASPDRARTLIQLLREIDSDAGDDRRRLDEIRAVAQDLARLHTGSQP